MDDVNRNNLVSVFTLMFPQTAAGSNIDATLTSTFRVSSGGSYKKNLNWQVTSNAFLFRSVSLNLHVRRQCRLPVCKSRLYPSLWHSPVELILILECLFNPTRFCCHFLSIVAHRELKVFEKVEPKRLSSEISGLTWTRAHRFPKHGGATSNSRRHNGGMQ